MKLTNIKPGTHYAHNDHPSSTAVDLFTDRYLVIDATPYARRPRGTYSRYGWGVDVDIDGYRAHVGNIKLPDAIDPKPNAVIARKVHSNGNLGPAEAVLARHLIGPWDEWEAQRTTERAVEDDAATQRRERVTAKAEAIRGAARDLLANYPDVQWPYGVTSGVDAQPHADYSGVSGGTRIQVDVEQIAAWMQAAYEQGQRAAKAGA